MTESGGWEGLENVFNSVTLYKPLPLRGPCFSHIFNSATLFIEGKNETGEGDVF